jgi:hypothetical protein
VLLLLFHPRLYCFKNFSRQTAAGFCCCSSCCYIFVTPLLLLLLLLLLCLRRNCCQQQCSNLLPLYITPRGPRGTHTR